MMILIMLGLMMMALARRLLIVSPALYRGICPVMTFVISAVLWWVTLTVMVSAAALRWQVAQDRVSMRSGRHTVTARHRRR